MKLIEKIFKVITALACVVGSGFVVYDFHFLGKQPDSITCLCLIMLTIYNCKSD